MDDIKDNLVIETKEKNLLDLPTPIITTKKSVKTSSLQNAKDCIEKDFFTNLDDKKTAIASLRKHINHEFKFKTEFEGKKYNIIIKLSK